MKSQRPIKGSIRLRLLASQRWRGPLATLALFVLIASGFALARASAGERFAQFHWPESFSRIFGSRTATPLSPPIFVGKTWDGGAATTNWEDANNWNPDGVPTSADDVVLDNTSVAGSYTISLSTAQTVRSLQIGYSGNPNTIEVDVSSVTTNVLTVNGGGSTALHVADGGVLKNLSTSGTRGILLSGAADVFKMSGTGRYIHATTTTNSKIPQRTSGTVAANYDFATTAVFENQSGNAASFDATPVYGSYTLNKSGTNTANQNLTINGDVNVVLGTLNVTDSGTNTFTIGGNVAISSGAVLQGTSANGTATLNITGSVTGGGTLTGNNASTSTLGTANITIGGDLSSLISLSAGTNATLTFSGGTTPVSFAPANGSTPTVQIVFVGNGTNAKTVNLGANISVAAGKTFTVRSNGTLNCGTNVVSGAGGFSLASGSTLGIGDPNGITDSDATATGGNIRVSGGRIFTSLSSYTYNGSVAQVTGNGLPDFLGGTTALTINNSGGGVTLSQPFSTNLLTLTNGTFTTGSNLTLAAATVTRAAGGFNASDTPTITGSHSLTYIGSTAVTTGPERPASGSITVLSVSNTAGVTLGGNLTTGSTSSVSSGGILNTGAFTFSNATTFTNNSGGTINVDPGGTFSVSSIFTNSGALNVNGSFQINSSASLTGNNYVYGASSTLIFNSSGVTVTGTPAYWPTTNGPPNVTVQGSAGINMGIARTVSGLFQYSNGVAGANNLTLNGTSQVNNGGFLSGAPTYGSSSLLKYNVNASYGRNSEWMPNVTTGGGYPANVQLSNNTNLDLPNGSTGAFFQMGGNLTIDSGSTINLNGSPAMTQALRVLGGVTNSGTVTLSSASGGDLNVGGSFANTGGTFSHNSRVLTFNGGAAQTWSDNNAQNFGAVTINNTSGGVSLNSAISCQSLTLTNGKVTTTSSNLLTVNGTSAGAVSNGSASSYVNGPLARVLPASLATGSTYVFPVGKSGFNPFELVDPTTTAGGTMTLRAEEFDLATGGSAGAGLSSINSDRFWTASITNGSGNFTDTKVRLTNSSALSASNRVGKAANPTDAFVATGGVVSGNTILSSTFSSFSSFVIGTTASQTISGTLFDAAGSPITSGRTIKLLQNGTSLGTTTTNGSGDYSFSGVTLASGDRIAVYIFGATEKGATVTLSGSSDINNLNIIQNSLIVRTDNGVGITNANLKNAAGGSPDADLLAVKTVDGSNVLTLPAGINLQIWSGSTFAPGANIFAGGSWTNNGTFVPGAGTVTFNGNANQKIGGSASTTFNALTISNTGTSPANVVSLDGSAGATNMAAFVLSVTSGVFDQGAGPASSNLALTGTGDVASISSGASWQNFGTGDLTLSGDVSNSGTIEFNGNGTPCGGNDDILIRSSSSPTQRVWKGTGTFSMTDVDVKDQKVPGLLNLPLLILVNSGTDSGNNVGWTFNPNCGGPYTWIGGASQKWFVPANWSPVRTTAGSASTADELIFDGNVTPAPIITDVPNQTNAAIRLKNGVFGVTLNAQSGGATLTLNGATGTDLDIPNGTLLTLAGAEPLTVSLTASGQQGAVAGQLIMQGGAHRLLGSNAGEIIMTGTNAFTTSTGFTGNPFGTGTNGSVVFQSGATGAFNAGGDPFGGSGHTVVTFNSGSTARFGSNTAFSSDGRTYGNLILDGNANYLGSGSNQTTVLNNFEIESGSSLTLSGSAGGDLNLQGNFEDQNTTADTFNANGRTVKFQGGTTTQTVFKSAPNPLTFFDVFIAGSSPGKVQLLSSLTISGQLNLSTADSLLQLNNQTLSLNGTVIGPGNLKGDASATLNIGGTTGGSLGTLRIVSDTLTQLSQMMMNRTGSGSSVTFGNDLDVDDALNLTNGIVDMGALTLTIHGNVTRTNGWIIGNQRRFFPCNTSCSITFDVGTGNGYSPISEVFSSNANTTYNQTVKAVEGQHPSIHNVSANALRRYWTLSTPSPAIGSADITFKYRGGNPPGGDVVGSESNYKIFRYSGGFTQFNPSVAIDTVNHTATLNGVTTFSDWTLAEAGAVTPGNLQFSAANFNDAEQNSSTHTATITVKRVGGSDGPVAVHWATSAGTASAGSDYTESFGDLNWADGDVADKIFTVTVSGDAVYEANETVNLTLSAPTGGAGLGTPNPATLTITNDDAPPTTLTVNTTDDVDNGACLASHCSLREAINAANLNSDTSTINFDGTVFAGPGPYTINLTGALADLSTNMSINGPGAAVLTVRRDTGGIYRIFTITSGQTVNISGLTIANGNGNIFGGGIYDNGGTLNLSDSTVTGGTAALGGGIASSFGSAVTVTNSTVSGNTTGPGGDGGGIYHGGNTFIVTNSTVSGNTAGRFGGGIQIGGGLSLTVINSTVSGNTSDGNGGGIWNGSANVTLVSCTISNNTATGNLSGGNGGGVFINFSGPVDLRNTIVAGNFANGTGPDVSGSSFTSRGHNLIGKSDGSSNFTNGSNGDQVGTIASPVNPLLDALGNYGGSTQTHRLQSGSPAIEAGDSCVFDNSCSPVYGVTLTTDQRGVGFSRKIDANFDSIYTVDIGAYEIGAANRVQFAFANTNDTETNSGSHVANVIVRRAGGSSGAVSVTYTVNDGTATTGGSDYSASPSSASFNWADGDITDRLVPINVNGDSVYEANETVSLVLSAPGGATLGTPSTATLTIVNDDAPSATLTVNTTNDVDDGICNPAHCSLREAINAANFSGDTSAIHFDSTVFAVVGGPYTINLTGALPSLGSNLSINGPGAGVLTVRRDTGGDYSVFTTSNNATVFVSGLTISNGSAPNGGGIFHTFGSTLTLNTVTISGCTASVAGGGIYAGGALTINNSTIANNSVSGSSAIGGGMFTGSSTLVTINHSTFSSNTSPNHGGAIGTNFAGSLIVNNSTLSGNSASTTGGALINQGSTVFNNCTITGNSAGQGGGVRTFTGGVSFLNTIVAGNTSASGPDLFGGYTSNGHNLIGKSDGSSGFTNAVNGDQVGTVAAAINPLLDALGNYGGPTQTHRLQTGSPAIDAGDNCVYDNSCSPAVGVALTTDQRGASFDRKIDGNSDGTATVDIGAYEAPTCTTPPATPVPSNGGPYCEGATIQLSTATVSGATYSWTGPNGFTSSQQNPTRANATLSDAGSYSVTVTVGSCTSAAGTTNVVVNPVPATPTASNGGPYCEGATIQLSTPTVSGATYSWTGPNGFTSALQNPSRANATTADAGTYSVTVTVNGCTSAAGTTNVVVNATPATPTVSNGGPYCEGATIQLSTPTVSGATYSWTGPNGFTSSLQNPTRANATTADAGTYSVTVTVNGCTSAAGSTNVVVNTIPATPTASNGGPYCEGATIQLSTPTVSGATYSWTGPNGFTSALQNPSRANATTADAGSYSVTVTVNGCTSAAGTTNVVVNATPATPTASNGGPYIQGDNIQLSTPTVSGATYSWTGPNGFTSSLQNPTRANATTSDAGTYSVTVTVNGCTSAAGTTNVVVNLPPPDTDVAVSGNSLLITDANGGNTDDTLTISLNGSNVRINDPNHTLNCGSGATVIDANTCEVLLSSINSIQVNTMGGNDSLTVALAGGDCIPSGGLSYDGGGQTTADKLYITGGSQGTVTYNYTNANDGSVVMSNYGTVSYTGLEPISNTGSATDLIFNLPAAQSHVATLSDLGGGNSRLSSGGTFEQTDFANPSGSVTINAGDLNDFVGVNALAANYPSLTINGGKANDSVNFNGNITFAANANLDVNLQNDDANPGIDNVSVTGQLTTSGTGTIDIRASEDVIINSPGGLKTQNGNLTVEANQQATSTATEHDGVQVNGATVQSTGTGNISIKGRGGQGAFDVMYGVIVWNGGKVLSTGTGTVEVKGEGGARTGGALVGSELYGVYVYLAGSEISSSSAAIQITGKGGATNDTGSYGVVVAGGKIQTSGAGALTINGTGGTCTGGNANTANSLGVAVTPDDTATPAGGIVTSTGTGVNAGNISITGIAGDGGNGASQGVRVDGPGTVTTVDGSITLDGTGSAGGNACLGTSIRGAVTATGAGAITITGNGANSTGSFPTHGVNVRSGGSVTAFNGNITLTGTGGNGTDNAGFDLAPIGTTGTGTVQTTGAGNIIINADRVRIRTTAAAIVDAGANAVSIRPRTAATFIDLGSTTDTTAALELSDAELDRVTCGTLNIGDSNSESITVTADITRTASTAMALVAGCDIVISGGQVITGGGTLLLDSGPSPDAVKPTKAGTDVTASTLSFGSDLSIVINGTTVDSQYTQLSVAGDVNLTGVDLALSGSYTPAGGEVFIIVNNGGSNPITGTFNGLAEGATIPNFRGSGLSATITYAGGTGNDVLLTVSAAPCPTITINQTTLPDGTQGTVYPNTNITASGGTAPYTFAVTNGSLPGGLTLDSNGLLHGTPTVAGTFNFTVTATDAGNCTGSQAYTVKICPTSLVVNTTGDEPDFSPGDGVCETASANGFCTLRAAIMESNALTTCGPLTITFNLLPGSEPQLITLESALPPITRSVTIEGPTGQMVSVDGAYNYRIFEISSATSVSISNLVIQNASEANNGAGLLVSGSATVNLSNCVFTGNVTDDANGGAIYNAAGTLNIWNCTIAYNEALYSGNGGGVYNHNGIVNLTNDTISENGADTNGGGVYNNTGTVKVRNTIIAGNYSPGWDIFGAFNTLGHNIIGAGDTGSGFANGVNNDHVGTVAAPFDPQLGLFDDHGGSTLTYSLLANSVAIDGGDDCVLTGCSGASPAITTDQRGVTRPQGAHVDIGAFETATYVVNTTADHAPGLCEPLTVGDCTLREAINAANSDFQDPSRIAFDIPTDGSDAGCVSGVCTIALDNTQGVLPAIITQVIIDGYTQSGATRNTLNLGSGDDAALKIVLSGVNLGPGAIGLDFCPGSTNSSVQGLVINNFQGVGIRLKNDGLNQVQGNFIGTDVTGTLAAANGTGVAVVDGLLNSVGGDDPAARNLISGNTGDGVRISGYNTGFTSVEGNFIGTKKNGGSALANNIGVNLYGFTGANTIGCEVENGDNVISGNTVAGIRIKESTFNLVEGNRIGTDNTGELAIPNGIGVDICDASDNAIGEDGFGNLISGNTDAGIRIKTTAGSSCPSENNVIYGNRIGTKSQGLSALPNDTGILVQDSSYNDIGSGDVQDRNLISGNTYEGIRLENSNEIVVFGNFIGTDANGVAAVANGAGVEISGGTANEIGCTFYGSGNVISGNIGDGVEITGSANGNFVQNNQIGVQANGTSPLANGGVGVEVYIGATNNIIGVEPDGGGTERTPAGAAAKGSARVAGANVQSAGGGCSKRGTSNSRNTEAFKSAQQLKSKAASLTQKSTRFAGRAAKSVAAARSLPGAKVKGTAKPGKDGIGPRVTIITGANVIANNGEEGVKVSSPGDINNLISQNSIYSNGKLGINLVGGSEDANGVTADDTNDPDPGPNNLQNYPVITSAITSTGTTINGTLNSGADQDYVIEFFASDNPSPGKDPSGFGEGQTFIGSISVTTTGNNASFSFSPAAPVPLGSWITATATDSSSNTSEFSGAVQVTGPVSDVSVAIVSPSPATVPEDSGTDIVYRFTRSDSSASLTVDFGVSGTASFTSNDYSQTGAGTFTNTGGQVTFNTGQSTVDVTVHPTADSNPEADETVTFTVVAGSGYNVVAPSTATGTILNDDNCPTSFLVTHANDSHDADPGDGTCLDSSQRCTLRAAIEEANALVSCGTIDINFAFSSEAIIVLPLGELSVQHNVNINGPTTYYLTIDGNGQYRGFNINSGKVVSISNLMVTDCVSNANGGGILNSGTLTLSGVTVMDNTAASGGGIASLTNNSLTLINTTISGNSASGDGGGLYNATGVAALTNVTIAYNTANSDNSGTESGGGIFVASGDVNLHNTIVADNFKGTVGPAADDIGGLVNAASSYNVIGTGAGGLVNGGNNNQVGVATAFLKPLQANGGSTLTHALTYKSAAVDTGDGCVVTGCGGNSPVVAVDQRGLSRTPPNDGDDNGSSGVDIGAYERQVTETREVFNGFNSSVDVVDAILTFPCVEPCEGGRVNPGNAKRDRAITPTFATPTASLASIDPAPLNSLTRPPNLVIGNSSSPALPAFEVTTTATYTPPATVCFYLPAITDAGFFAGLKVLHREAGPNTTYGDSDDVLVDVTRTTNPTDFANKLVCAEVNSFSAFAIAHTASPTAADGSVSGQIVDTNGNPVQGAAVRLSGSQNRLAITDAEGKYHFDNVETNGLYVVTPARPNFTFNPVQRSFSQLGAHTDATFTASPAAGALNPLDATEYFVRQQYLDFLGREPDEAGFNFWVNNIESCGNDLGCREVKRIDTSAAFFLSIEFQQTGYVVYRTYQAAFGDLREAPVPVQLAEFRGDAARISKGVVVLQDGWQRTLETNKKLYAEDFVKRDRFAAEYPLTMTPTEFVDKLFANAAIPVADGDYAAAIAEFGRATDTSDLAARGRALLRVAENSTLTRRRFNRAFVLMEYFGYLRRDPNSGQDRDFAGYNFWLDKLDRFNGNFQDAEMVKAFLSSIEYRARFPR